MNQEENIKQIIKGGPQTEEGKAISRYNSVKHGLLSRETLMKGEDEDGLNDLERSVYLVFKPEGIMEEMMADRIINCMWRLRRAIVIERNVMEFLKSDEEQFAMLTSGDIKRKAYKSIIDSESVEKILRYETTIERSLYRSIHEINKLQSGRNGVNTPLDTWTNLDINSASGFVSQK